MHIILNIYIYIYIFFFFQWYLHMNREYVLNVSSCVVPQQLRAENGPTGAARSEGPSKRLAKDWDREPTYGTRGNWRLWEQNWWPPLKKLTWESENIWKHQVPRSETPTTAGIGCCRWRFCQESCRSAGQMGCGSAKEVPGAEGCSDFVSSRRWAGSLLSCVLVRSHSGTLCYSILIMELMYAVFIFWYTLLKFWCSLFLLLLLLLWWWWWWWWFCLPHLLWIGWGCFYKQDNSWKRKLRDWCKRTRRLKQAGVLNGPNHLHNISWRV